MSWITIATNKRHTVRLINFYDAFLFTRKMYEKFPIKNSYIIHQSHSSYSHTSLQLLDLLSSMHDRNYFHIGHTIQPLEARISLSRINHHPRVISFQISRVPTVACTRRRSQYFSASRSKLHWTKRNPVRLFFFRAVARRAARREGKRE